LVPTPCHSCAGTLGLVLELGECGFGVLADLVGYGVPALVGGVLVDERGAG
jgi:hypothetical protein